MQSERVKQKCAEEFHKFLRSQPVEVDPTSELHELLEMFFQRGFAEGGNYGMEALKEIMAKGN